MNDPKLALQELVQQHGIESMLEYFGQLAKEGHAARKTDVDARLYNALHYALCTVNIQRTAKKKPDMRDLRDMLMPAWKVYEHVTPDNNYSPATRDLKQFMKE